MSLLVNKIGLRTRKYLYVMNVSGLTSNLVCVGIPPFPEIPLFVAALALGVFDDLSYEF